MKEFVKSGRSLEQSGGTGFFEKHASLCPAMSKLGQKLVIENDLEDKASRPEEQGTSPGELAAAAQGGEGCPMHKLMENGGRWEEGRGGCGQPQ